LGVVINVYLMFRLSTVTLVRFTVWMIIGKKEKQPPFFIAQLTL